MGGGRARLPAAWSGFLQHDRDAEKAGGVLRWSRLATRSKGSSVLPGHCRDHLVLSAENLALLCRAVETIAKKLQGDNDDGRGGKAYSGRKRPRRNRGAGCPVSLLAVCPLDERDGWGGRVRTYVLRIPSPLP